MRLNIGIFFQSSTVGPLRKESAYSYKPQDGRGEYWRLGFIEHVSARKNFRSNDSGLKYEVDFADRSWIAAEHAYAKNDRYGDDKEYFVNLV